MDSTPARVALAARGAAMASDSPFPADRDHTKGMAVDFIDPKNAASAAAVLMKESRELYLDRCAVLDGPPTALGFYRDFVSRNLPCVIRGACPEHALRWTAESLRAQVGHVPVSVEVTPTGLGDAVVHRDGAPVFVMPHTQTMRFGDFLDAAQGKSADPLAAGSVRYLSHQNSNLVQQLPQLLAACGADVPFATGLAFGYGPDAVNIWMGPDAAVTSLHKDHYENLYCVLAGEKIFTLIPPTDRAALRHQLCRVAAYRQTGPGEWTVETLEDEPLRPWIVSGVDAPTDFLKAHFPDEADSFTGPMRVHVRAGEMLYLPSLWFHQVEQAAGSSGIAGLTVAVNYWYDMAYDIKYAYFQHLDKLASVA